MAAEAEIDEMKGSKGSKGSKVSKGATDQVKLPILTLLAVVIVGVVLAMAAFTGGLYSLVKSGKLPLGAAARTTAASAATGELSHPMVLEPILVNLADDGGHAYLRLGLTIDVEADAARPEEGKESKDAKDPKTPNEQDLAVRDTVLGVLGQQTSAWLLGPDGKEHLKIELKEALAKHNGEVKVKSVYFTDFLVQI